MPFVYILECCDRSYCVGSTWDVERRPSEHNEGLGAVYTRRRRPVALVWHAYHDSVAEAYAMEKRVQGWNRAKRRAFIEGRLSDLPGLASRAGRRMRPPVDQRCSSGETGGWSRDGLR
jgi:putative endonuclease